MAAIVHISEEEAARDFAAVIRRVRAGDEVVVEDADGPVAVMRPALENSRAVEEADASAYVEGKTAEEIINSLNEWEAKHGKVSLDPDFVSDMEAIHEIYNQPLDGSKWD
jgi:antitoxin (DNA-binding transcriptional repressor) of toxin-antitoxin stability system